VGFLCFSTSAVGRFRKITSRGQWNGSNPIVAIQARTAEFSNAGRLKQLSDFRPRLRMKCLGISMW